MSICESEWISCRIRNHVSQFAGAFKRIFFKSNLIFDADWKRQKHFWVNLGEPVAAQIDVLKLFKTVKGGTVDVRDAVVSQIKRAKRRK